MPIRVKICGITSAEDGVLAASLGAAAIGLVFWEESPRCVTPERAAAIGAAVGPLTSKVGVFVDAGAREIGRIVAEAGLDVVQLHGSEPRDLADRLSRPVIRSVACSPTGCVPALDEIPGSATVLFDAHDPERHGGTGRRANWSEAARWAVRRRVILSGGLRPTNVAEAIGVVRPYAVDVSSGVERAPGRKDPAKLAAFFAAVASVVAVMPGEVRDE